MSPACLVASCWTITPYLLDETLQDISKTHYQGANKRGIILSCRSLITDMQNSAEYNDGTNYLLTIIDVFSKYALVIPLQNKQGKTIARALDYIFRIKINNKAYEPMILLSDNGKEFIAKEVKQSWQKSLHISHQLAEPERPTCMLLGMLRLSRSKYKEKHKTQGPPTYPYQPCHCEAWLLSFSVQKFPSSLYKACSGHTKAYKCFAENLQTDHRKQAFIKGNIIADFSTTHLALNACLLCSVCLGGNLYTQITQKTQGGKRQLHMNRLS
ncbi:hypothetical protein PROFUN_15850 [Planoprotostelium fungivorum]|uniref:Integrase catalytic domain-containing protein n=1 Tax=Planoprotostelium fungivorum TaxID=1890364 RepID=A0A2P6MU20_9EUKA|nr:hypothetical protein PROFUN_15850 [Planoprotostelium fungivorum]